MWIHSIQNSLSQNIIIFYYIILSDLTYKKEYKKIISLLLTSSLKESFFCLCGSFYFRGHSVTCSSQTFSIMPVMYVVTKSLESLVKSNNHMCQEEEMSFNYGLFFFFANLEDHVNLLRLYPHRIIYISKSLVITIPDSKFLSS